MVKTIKNTKRHFVLSFDPGSTNLGIGFLGIKNTNFKINYQNREIKKKIINHYNSLDNFTIYWFELWNLQVLGKTLAENLTCLNNILTNHPKLKSIQKMAENTENQVDVIIEHQEGFGPVGYKNGGLLMRLMRINALSGCLWKFFTDKKFKVTFCGKHMKWGWIFFSKLPNRNKRKKGVVQFVEIVLNNLAATSNINSKNYKALICMKKSVREHPCDCILQGMYFLRDLFIKKNQYKNSLPEEIIKKIDV